MSEEKSLMLSKLPKETTMDRIYASYIESETFIVLTAEEEKVKQGWEKAWALLCNGYSTQNAVKYLMSDIGGKLKKSQAYNYVSSAIKLFGDVNKSSKEGYRSLLMEYAMHCYNIAKSGNPPDVESMIKAVKEMKEILGVKNDDPDTPDFSKFKQHIYEFNIEENEKKIIMKLAQRGVVNLSDMITETGDVIDVPHEEIKDDGKEGK